MRHAGVPFRVEDLWYKVRIKVELVAVLWIGVGAIDSLGEAAGISIIILVHSGSLREIYFYALAGTMG